MTGDVPLPRMTNGDAADAGSQARVSKSGLAVLFDGMCWVRPGDELAEIAWRLRYGGATDTDLMVAASALEAYIELIRTTRDHREYVVRNIKKSLASASEPRSAAERT